MLKEKLATGADEPADERRTITISYLGNTASNKIYLKEASLRCLHGGKIYRFPT